MPEDGLQRDYTYNQQAQGDQRRQQLPPPETQVEFLKFVVDPSTKNQYTHITKDLAISYADMTQIGYVHLNLQLLHLITFIEINHGVYKQEGDKYTMLKAPDMDPARHVILQDIYAYLQLLRSNGGFERIQEGTQTVRQHQTFNDTTKKGWGFIK